MADSRQPSDEEYDTGDNASVISNSSTDAHSLTGGLEGDLDLVQLKSFNLTSGS